MSKEKDAIAYEPHPVTPERKAELRAQGFRIIDAQFAPPMPNFDGDSPVVEVSGDGSGEVLPLISDEERLAPARRGRKPKAAE